MKKTKLSLVSLIPLFLIYFTACPPPSGGLTLRTGIDFRNKDKSGETVSFRSVDGYARAADDTALVQSMGKITTNEGGLSDSEIAKIITFEDSPAGIKVIFNTPEAMKGSCLDYFQMDYVEPSGKWSTQLQLDNEIRNDENWKVRDKFEFEYPLVLPDVETNFVFQIKSNNGINISFYKKVTPKHGKAKVDDLPDNMGEKDFYSEFKDGVMVLKNVVPPEAHKVWKTIYVQGIKSDYKRDDIEFWENWWTGDCVQVKAIEKDVDFGHKDDFYIGDMPTIDWGNSPIDFSNHPYCKVFIRYLYNLKNFDGLIFSTPNIESSTLSSSFFATPVENRKVSKTQINNKTVTFDGDGYFDGLYEGDLKVTYEGDSFVPAVFVYGLDVYILEVKDGKYILKTKKSISKFFEEGGSFGNIDSKKKSYAVLKTTTEANLDKSDVKEITLSEADDNSSDDTQQEDPNAIHIENIAEKFVLEANHPWVDGAQDMSVISNYQGIVDLTSIFGTKLPKKGDTIHLIWNGKSDIDVANIYIQAIDNTAAAGWWKELSDRKVLAKNIKANTPFKTEIKLNVTNDCVAGFVLCIQADKTDVTGVATIVKVE